jgi:hypothetical protein
MLRRVALVRTDILEEHIASIIKVKVISELVTTLAVTSNGSTRAIWRPIQDGCVLLDGNLTFKLRSTGGGNTNQDLVTTRLKTPCESLRFSLTKPKDGNRRTSRFALIFYTVKCHDSISISISRQKLSSTQRQLHSAIYLTQNDIF